MSDSHDKPYVLVGPLSSMQNIPKPEGHQPSGPTVMTEVEVCHGHAHVRPFDKPCKVDVLWDLKACSLMAFISLLSDRNVEFEITYAQGSSNPDELVITWDRMAMDEFGYHEGCELYSARCPILPTMTYGGPVSLPLGLDPWCLIPSMFSVIILQTPEASDTYCPPDDDFAWQEFNAILHNWDNDIPEAHFDQKTRTWTLGDWTWTVGTDPVLYW